MEGILLALAALTPLNVFMMILGGIIFGYAFKDFYFHRRTIYLSILWVVGFSLGRTLFVASAGASGAGLLGTILFLIYLISTLIARKIFTRNKRDFI